MVIPGSSRAGIFAEMAVAGGDIDRTMSGITGGGGSGENSPVLGHLFVCFLGVEGSFWWLDWRPLSDLSPGVPVARLPDVANKLGHH